MGDETTWHEAVWTLSEGLSSTSVIVRGDLDLASVPRLAADTRAHLDGRAVRLDCDLTGVSFADSQLVHWLLDQQDERTRAGGSLHVRVRPGGPVDHLFELLELGDRLDVAG